MNKDTHACSTTLTRDQWAWEFLRRNPDYQADYRRFVDVWHALEADYGAPPHRDFQRWKQDPRAYGPLPGDAELGTPSGELCAGEDDRILLECWMGAKWGFYKFPLDPQRTIPPGPDELAWRPSPALALRPAGDAYRLDIPFDLSLPLPPQLEAARLRLVSRAAELRRNGLAAPMTIGRQCAHWARLLHLLDSEAAGETTADADTRLLLEAKAMAAGGYLDILRLAEASPGSD